MGKKWKMGKNEKKIGDIREKSKLVKKKVGK